MRRRMRRRWRDGEERSKLRADEIPDVRVERPNDNENTEDTSSAVSLLSRWLRVVDC